MKTKNWNARAARVVVTALVAGGTLASAGSAFADMPYYPHNQYNPHYLTPVSAPVMVYGQPQFIPAGIQIVLGWQPDGRYWDGHRYWAHDEWMRHHPRDPGPPRHDHPRPDHRPYY